jgi:hypothetical protein
MTPEEFSKTVQEMANNNELAQPVTNVKRMKHFYRDGYTAMMANIRNMINTYGIDQVRDVLKHMIEYGDFNE